MVRRLKWMLLVLACAATGFGQVPIPNTPAGHALAAWLDAFNSGDRARIDAFVKSYTPKLTEAVVTSPQFRGRSGGVELLAITHDQPDTVAFRLREKSQVIFLIGRIAVTSQKSPTISKFALRAVPDGAEFEDIKLDPALRKQVIADIIDNLNEYYVYPSTAQKMADSLHAHETKGDYNAITNGEALAELVTAELFEVSHDKHLDVFYNPYKLGANPPTLTPDQLTESRKAMARDCGFPKLEILPNNVGYVKIDFFADPMACGRTAAAAMYFLSNTDALIFDLRENNGGDPRMVAMLCTYLFEQPTHLNDFYDRKEDKTTEYWTLRYVPGVRLGRKPAYVLTSPRTFSGAEEFAYDLRNLKRITVVGETTAGGSHPVSPHRAGDHFIIYVPGARSISPITKTDWEGTGVAPDVTVKAEDALEAAEKLASERIQQNASHETGAARVN